MEHTETIVNKIKRVDHSIPKLERIPKKQHFVPFGISVCMSGFLPFCDVCGTERKSGSSNRNLNFDYCLSCKTTTTFVKSRGEPKLLEAKNQAPLQLPLVLRFKDDQRDKELFECDEEHTSMRWVSIGKMKLRPAWLPQTTDQQLHSGKFTVKLEIEDMGEGQLGVVSSVCGFVLFFSCALM